MKRVHNKRTSFKTMSVLFFFVFLPFAALPSTVGAEMEKAVRMSYLQNDIHHLALWTAMERGLFTKEGVDVEISGVFRAGPEIMSAFAAGALDMAYVGEAPATTAVANGAVQVVVISQVNTHGSAMVVASNSTGISNWTDLKGKTVCIPGHSTVQDFLLKKALKKNGLSTNLVNIIVLKPPEMIDALRTGQVDGFIAWEPYPAKSVTSGIGTILSHSGDIWPDHPCCVLVVSSIFLQSSPDKVRAIVKAHVASTAFIKKNISEACKIAAKYTGMDEKTVAQAIHSVQYTYDLSIEEEKEYVTFLAELGYIKEADPDAFIKKFINKDILEEVIGP